MTTSPRSSPSKPAPKDRKSKVSPARSAAFRVLLKLEDGKSHSDDLLRSKAVNALAPPDRHLATALVLGVLRWQIQLDDQLQSLLTRPGAKLDAEVSIALRIAAFQILHMDRIPARAAIDESVELTKQAGYSFAAKMVNAVLRKLPGVTRKTPPDDTPQTLAIAEAHPLWMVERWAAFYGLDAARAICRHNQAQPRPTVRLATPEIESELALEGIVLDPGQLLNAARTVLTGDVASTKSFLECRIRIQDEGSQFVAEIAASLLANPHGSILDACAAPGGKTLILAERNPHATIVACEMSPRRFEELQDRLAPHGDRIECRLADATQLKDEAAFDVVLVDAPCSGTGTLGRNPEIRHRLRQEELPRQTERQRAILKAALRAVRPGGFVVYSTCSLEPEENEQVVQSVVEENRHYRPVAMNAILETMDRRAILTTNATHSLQNSVTQEGALRLLPGTFHTDGFFIAVIERIA